MSEKKTMKYLNIKKPLYFFYDHTSFEYNYILIFFHIIERRKDNIFIHNMYGLTFIFNFRTFYFKVNVHVTAPEMPAELLQLNCQ